MSQFNFIYAEEHLSHREKAVYIYLRDRADASGSLTSNLYRLTKHKTSQPPAKGGL